MRPDSQTKDKNASGVFLDLPNYCSLRGVESLLLERIGTLTVHSIFLTLGWQKRSCSLVPGRRTEEKPDKRCSARRVEAMLLEDRGEEDICVAAHRPERGCRFAPLGSARNGKRKRKVASAQSGFCLRREKSGRRMLFQRGE